MSTFRLSAVVRNDLHFSGRLSDVFVALTAVVALLSPITVRGQSISCNGFSTIQFTCNVNDQAPAGQRTQFQHQLTFVDTVDSATQFDQLTPVYVDSGSDGTGFGGVAASRIEGLLTSFDEEFSLIVNDNQLGFEGPVTAIVSQVDGNTFELLHIFTVPPDAEDGSTIETLVNIGYRDSLVALDDGQGFFASARYEIETEVSGALQDDDLNGDEDLNGPLPPPQADEDQLFTGNQRSVASAADTILQQGSGSAALEAMLLAIEGLPGDLQPGSYDAIAHEEVDGHRALGVQSAAAQARNIGDRMAELRAGATGVSLANLTLVAPGGMIDGETLADLLPVDLRGGGASGDAASPLSRLGIFVNGAIELGDRDSTSRRDGLDYTTVALTIGADYRITDDFVLGAAFGYADSDGDFDRGGGIEVESYSGQVFGLYYPIENLSIDVLAGTAWLDYDMRRRVTIPTTLSATARSDTDARQYFAGVGVTYDVPFEGATISPFGRLDFQRLEVDGFRERGASPANLDVNDQNVNSLTSALGVQASYPISTRFGILQPQLRAQWVHQFEDDAQAVNAFFVEDNASTRFNIRTESPDRNWIDLGASLSLTTIGGLSAFVDYDGTFVNDDLDRHRITAGLRYQF